MMSTWSCDTVSVSQDENSESVMQLNESLTVKMKNLKSHPMEPACLFLGSSQTNDSVNIRWDGHVTDQSIQQDDAMKSSTTLRFGKKAETNTIIF